MILLLYQLSYAAERRASRAEGERETLGSAWGEVKAASRLGATVFQSFKSQ